MKNIIIRPIISEKSDLLADGQNKYTFQVMPTANKIEIRKAIEDLYPGVTVTKVNTMNVPAKRKTRNTKAGLIRGSVSGYKKAIISLSEGDEIDFFGEL